MMFVCPQVFYRSTKKYACSLVVPLQAVLRGYVDFKWLGACPIRQISTSNKAMIAIEVMPANNTLLTIMPKIYIHHVIETSYLVILRLGKVIYIFCSEEGL